MMIKKIASAIACGAVLYGLAKLIQHNQVRVLVMPGEFPTSEAPDDGANTEVGQSPGTAVEAGVGSSATPKETEVCAHGSEAEGEQGINTSGEAPCM